MNRFTIAFQLIVAGLIRLGLIYSQYRQVIANRVEVSTVLNSWKRITEGVALYDYGISPYSGDLFHGTPIELYLSSLLINHAPAFIGALHVAVDLMTGIILFWTASAYMKEMEEKQKSEIDSYAKGVDNLLITQRDMNLSPMFVLAVYLFNPYNILNCVGLTTTTLGNLCLALLYLSMVRGYRLLACAALSFSVLQSLYPVVLIVPLCLYLAKDSSSKLSSVLLTLTTFILMSSLLLYASHRISGDWSFLESVFAVALTVSDLRPNIGLFWYFFTEMFEHFRLLFVFSFQLNASLLYLAPLSLRFYSDPMLLAASLTSLVSIFKSYPCLGDVGFYFSLLPMWKHLFNSKAVVPDMQQSFVILCTLVITSVLGPTVWHLWIYSMSANANFYFGVTLAFATAQIFLITDILFAYIKREFTLKQGIISEEDRAKVRLCLE